MRQVLYKASRTPNNVQANFLCVLKWVIKRKLLSVMCPSQIESYM